MTDHLTQNRRSWNMSRIKSKHSKPEMIIRSLLHRSGYRFRINDNKLPDCPDIILPKYNMVIFVTGCFWHRHEKFHRATMPNSNEKYWKNKFDKNVSRDIIVKKTLEKQGWNVLFVWECEVIKDPIDVLEKLQTFPHDFVKSA